MGQEKQQQEWGNRTYTGSADDPFFYGLLLQVVGRNMTNWLAKKKQIVGTSAAGI